MTKRVLPHTAWMADSQWALQAKPIAVLMVALTLFGSGEGMVVLASLGSTPWTVLAQGLSLNSGLSLGMITMLVGMVVLVLWIPLKLKPGLGTILNMLMVALFLQLTLMYIPPPDNFIIRAVLCVSGVLAIGVASALYLTCHMGAGPRDGLMVGLCQKTGWRVGVVRTSLEAVVCLIGWLLGGTVGLGTVLFAVGVGWVVQTTLQFITVRYALA